MTIPPMVPSVQERVDRCLNSKHNSPGRRAAVAWEVIDAYHDGFLAAVALLREPSDELIATGVNALKWPSNIGVPEVYVLGIIQAVAAKLGELR